MAMHPIGAMTRAVPTTVVITSIHCHHSKFGKDADREILSCDQWAPYCEITMIEKRIDVKCFEHYLKKWNPCHTPKKYFAMYFFYHSKIK